MKAKRHSEEQVIGALQEANGGAKVKEVCRRLGVSRVTFFRGKAKFFSGAITVIHRAAGWRARAPPGCWRPAAGS